MKIGDALLTIGLVGLALFAAFWIYQQSQTTAATNATNQAAAINVNELEQAAALAQAETLINSVGSAPVATAPASSSTTTSTSSGTA